MDIQNYLDERVDDQIKYYSKRSRDNKDNYLAFKVSQIIAAALLPFFSIFITDGGPFKYVVALLGTAVTVLEGVLAVGKYHEKWIIYRSTSEMLRQEKYLFLMKAGNYNAANSATLFVTKIEFILGKENASWQQVVVKDNKQQDGEDNRSERPNGGSKAAVGKSESEKPVPPANAATEEPARQPAEPFADEEATPVDPITGVSSDVEATNENPAGGVIK